MRKRYTAIEIARYNRDTHKVALKFFAPKFTKFGWTYKIRKNED